MGTRELSAPFPQSPPERGRGCSSSPPPLAGGGWEKGKDLAAIAATARACRACPGLPLGPRPVFRVSTTARVLIAGQAPGTKAHETGIPWNDASGERLRDWLGMDRETFYDESAIAIVPMGLCYPGRLPNGGDAPPRPACAPLWRARLIGAMPAIRLTLLVGGYAQRDALGAGTVGERVSRFCDYLPAAFPLPHPSWRTTAWERRNPWFAAEALPALRETVAKALEARDERDCFRYDGVGTHRGASISGGP